MDSNTLLLCLLVAIIGGPCALQAADSSILAASEWGVVSFSDVKIDRDLMTISGNAENDRLAAQLNAEELQTRTRGRWHGVMVNRILNRGEK